MIGYFFVIRQVNNIFLLKKENAILGSNKNVNHHAPQSVAPKHNTESDIIQENNYVILKLY